MKKILPLIATLALLLSACENVSEKSADSDKISVYTSFYAMYDFAKAIGGDKADVKVLCPVGVEPHDYEPTAADMAKLSEADIFIYKALPCAHAPRFCDQGARHGFGVVFGGLCDDVCPLAQRG